MRNAGGGGSQKAVGSAPAFEVVAVRVYGLKVSRRSKIDRTRVIRGLQTQYHEDYGPAAQL